MEVFMS